MLGMGYLAEMWDMESAYVKRLPAPPTISLG